MAQNTCRRPRLGGRPDAQLNAFLVACRPSAARPLVHQGWLHTSASAQEGCSLLSPSSFQKMKSSASPPMRGSATGGRQKGRRSMGSTAGQKRGAWVSCVRLAQCAVCRRGVWQCIAGQLHIMHLPHGCLRRSALPGHKLQCHRGGQAVLQTGTQGAPAGQAMLDRPQASMACAVLAEAASVPCNTRHAWLARASLWHNVPLTAATTAIPPTHAWPSTHQRQCSAQAP